jgi:hypothetical protein
MNVFLVSLVDIFLTEFFYQPMPIIPLKVFQDLENFFNDIHKVELCFS